MAKIENDDGKLYLFGIDNSSFSETILENLPYTFL